MQNFIGGGRSASSETVKIWQAILDRAALAEAVPEPFAYLCPAGCGCTWRPAIYMEAVKQEMFGLLGENSKSCKVCENLPLDKLIPLYAAPPSASPTVGQCETRKEREPMQLPDPDPASPSDARDAARYRWLRDEADENWVEHAWHTVGPEEMDAKIDDEMIMFPKRILPKP